MAVNLLDSFLQGAYWWTIPLLLVERGIDLATIGAVFAAYPLVFFLSRMLFASVADSVGLRAFFNLNALTAFCSAVIYALSRSPFSFAIAKAAQGLKDSSLWAVNRNAAYEIAKDKEPQMVSATILFVRALGVASGAVLSGILMSTIGFLGIFVLLAVLSVVMFVPASMLDIGPRKKLDVNELLMRLRPDFSNQKLWHISLVMGFHTMAAALISGYILPIFLRSKGMGYWEIATMSAVYAGAGVFLLPFTLRRVPPIKQTTAVQLLLYVPAVMVVPFCEEGTMISMVILMALGESASYIVWESLIHHAVEGSENVATAIGWVHLPAHLVHTFALISAGMLTENLGYLAPFWISGISFLLYSIFAWRSLKDIKKRG